MTMAVGDIEEFAEMRAAIESGEARDAVLARADLSVSQWIAIQRRWLRALALEAAQGRRDLARRYAARFGAATTSEQSAAPESTTAPFVAAPASPGKSPDPSPSETPVFRPPVAAVRPSATRSMPAYLPALATTPFRADPNALPPPSAAAELEAEAASMVGETAFVSAITDEELGLSGPGGDLDGTAEISSLDLGDLDVLPFDGARAAAPPPSAVEEVEREAASLVGETSFVAALTDEDLGAALPFEPRRPPPQQRDAPAAPASAPPSEVLELTVRQYASLLAELHREAQHRPAGSPELASHRRAILARYRLDEVGFQRLESVWSERFREQPASYGAFRSAYDEYSQWLIAQSR
jgi:hypothetical protein